MIELHNMDCLEYMKGLEDNAFDICVTSPPYNMNLRVNSKGDGYVSRQIVKEISTKYSGYDDNLPMAEYEDFLARVIDELLRISEITFFNIQMITGNKPALFRLMGRYADQIKEVIIWDKCRGQPAIRDGCLNSAYEFILVLGSNPITRRFPGAAFPRGTLDNIWRVPAKSSRVKGHGATFPLELCDMILGNFAGKGDKVFDPFMGTGTTAISSYYAGMDFTGCEISLDYLNSARERIERETAQVDMF